MQRINTWAFYSLGYDIHPLSALGWKSTLSESFLMILSGRSSLLTLLGDEIMDLPLSKEAGRNLYNAIEKVMPDGQILEDADWGAELGVSASGIGEATKKFEHVLAAELGFGDTYFVTQKGIYNTTSLIEQADKMFSSAILENLPEETINDIRMAGKCLAFELSTASGFHATRAIEDVVREYYKTLSESELKLENRSWGHYIIQLEKHNPDEKIIGILKQIKDTHRNPIDHTDETLTLDEANNLLGIARSAITALVTEIQRVKATPMVVAVPDA